MRFLSARPDVIKVALQTLSVSDQTSFLGDGTDVSLPFDLTINSTLLLELIAVAVVTVLWFLVYAAALTATRPADVDPLPANADIPGD